MKSSIRISPGWIGSIRSLSVVVDEFDIVRTSISPDEAETPLRVDADAVLSASVADQTLQVVARRGPGVLDILRRVDQLELPHGRPLHRPVDALDVLLMPDALGAFTSERPDHDTNV